MKMSARIALGVLPASVKIDARTSTVTIQQGDAVPVVAVEVAVGVVVVFMRWCFLIPPAGVPGGAALLWREQEIGSAAT